MKYTPFESGKFYHVFNRGNNRENIFYEERNYTYFMDKIIQYLSPIINLYSYCLMPNHFHLVIQIKEQKDLPVDYIQEKKYFYQAFSNCFNSYTKSINKAYNRRGSLFQEHLHRLEIQSEEYLKAVIIYTHLNPVKHKIFDTYEDYPYSSYQVLLSHQTTDIMRGEVISIFSDMENFVYCHRKQLYTYKKKLEEIEIIDG